MYSVFLFDKDSSTPLWRYYTTGGDEVTSVDISANGDYIVAAIVDAGGSTEDSYVYLFGKDSSTPIWTYEIESEIRSVAISSDGEYIAAGSGGSEDSVYLFDKDSSTPLWRYNTIDMVNSVAISADGEYIVAGSENNK